MVDITDALAPNSDQLDAVELVRPRTFTIAPGSGLGQREGKTVAEIRLVDFPRVWRPSKGMLDVLAACWGTDAKQWVGRRVTLYCDPEVMFGPDKVGGIRISHLSHIDRKRSVTIRAPGAGRKQGWPIDPLPDVTAAARVDTLEERVAKMVDAFAALGVTEEQIATHTAAPRSAWSADVLDALLIVHQSIRSGEQSAREAFPGPGFAVGPGAGEPES